VDHNGTLILSYEDKGFAALQYSLDVNTTEETTIYGTRGHIKLHSPAHCPERMTVVTHSDDSDHVPGPKIERFEFPLGPLAEGETYNYPNQSGFRYQIEAVQQCIQLGQLESPEYTHEQMMQNMAVLQMAMRQMNVNVVDQACQPPVALQLCETPLQQRTASMHA
jgi:dihydrodiol dehydrogenase / D-xylose 1-dehydrogenase (NADP)